MITNTKLTRSIVRDGNIRAVNFITGRGGKQLRWCIIWKPTWVDIATRANRRRTRRQQ